MLCEIILTSVPAANFSNSKTPIGPFQITVLLAVQRFTESVNLFDHLLIHLDAWMLQLQADTNIHEHLSKCKMLLNV
jgi:hypothetical protein